MTNKKIGKELLDIGISSIFLGTGLSIIEGSPLPGNIKTGAEGLLVLGFAKGISKKFE